MIRNNVGSSVVMSMVFIGVVLVVTAGSVGLFSSHMKYIKSTNYGVSAFMIRQNIYQKLSNTQAWDLTLQANSSLDCVKNGTTCSAFVGKKNAINVIKDVDNSDYIDLSVEENGFNVAGGACSNFSAASDATGDCVYKIQSYWEPHCADINCMSPLVKMTVEFSANFGSEKGIILNPGKYNVTIFK